MALTRTDAKKICASCAQMGLRETDPRLDSQIDQAMKRLVRYHNAFVRREEYDTNAITFAPNLSTLQLDAPDALKLMVLALWREENNEFQLAEALEAKANALVQQEIVQSFEAANKTAWKVQADSGTAYCRNWYAAKLGLDTAGGLTTSYVKLKRYVHRAGVWIYQKIYEYQLIDRNRVHVVAPTLVAPPASDTVVYNPAIDYEVMRLVCQAFALEGAASVGDASPQQLSAQFLQQAAALIARRLDAELEALRHSTYTTALTSLSSDTFGYTKAQIALEMQLGLKLSRAELGRLVNSAERRLVECGKWKNSIADFEIAIGENGETDMPAEVEVVLGATICDQPTLIRGRWYEVVEGGPGRVREDRRSVTGILVDRGEFIVSGVPRRRYFVSACQPGNTLMVRAKRRFSAKSADADLMQIRNFGAIKAAAQALMHEGFAGAELAGIALRDPALATFYWSTAKRILADELTEYVGEASQGSMPVQTVGFGAGEIPSLL